MDDGGFARREMADDYIESKGVWCDVCGGELIDCGGCGQLVDIDNEDIGPGNDLDFDDYYNGGLSE